MAPGEPFSQRRIGLTGGIASGKSSVGRWLAQQGLPVFDADQYAREALKPGQQATKTVLQRYGSSVQAEGGAAIDRAALGRIVFQDPAERHWLEQLIHPIVRERFDQARISAQAPLRRIASWLSNHSPMQAIPGPGNNRPKNCRNEPRIRAVTKLTRKGDTYQLPKPQSRGQ